MENIVGKLNRKSSQQIFIVPGYNHQMETLQASRPCDVPTTYYILKFSLSTIVDMLIAPLPSAGFTQEHLSNIVENILSDFHFGTLGFWG